MRQIAVCFLIKDSQVLLLRVHYPDGHEIWNGVSGWVEEGEGVKQGIVREIKEEIGVDVNEGNLKKGYVSTSEGFPITAFTVNKWVGIPRSNEESIKELKWFDFENIPFDLMIKDNRNWLPKMLETV